MTREEAIEFISQSVKSDVDMAKVADAIETLGQLSSHCSVCIHSYQTDIDFENEIKRALQETLKELDEAEGKAKMTKEQAVKILKADETDDYSFIWDELGLKGTEDFNRAYDEAYDMAIKALEESRNITNEELHQDYIRLAIENERLYFKVKSLQERLQKGVTITDFADKCRECGKMKRCKDCKYFEYDSVAKVDGIPLIVAHEICNRWGDGCKTKEDGYCFLFESKAESEEEK